ncbi:MAG: hypothetical protein HC892_23880 [Saprospiraceae bacterium]|nr:hypothetical protein [Saprospiraceae bacterium]
MLNNGLLSMPPKPNPQAQRTAARQQANRCRQSKIKKWSQQPLKKTGRFRKAI